ncbi:MAG: cytochrome c3 family protein [Deltaproteobacteria bacterium]|nr:cytochrome c3 family protein [Deltaproteobacteria bacterium]
MNRHALRARSLVLAASACMLAGTASGAAPPKSAPHGSNGNGAVKQPTCANCHTCAEPTEANVCLKACPRLFSAQSKSSHDIIEAPEQILINKLADQYAGVQFNHKLHAGMSEMGKGCAVCHHFCPPGKIPSCESCHEAGGRPADLRQPGLKGAYHRQCLQCHREWSHETDCTVCHLQKTGTSSPTAPSVTCRRPAPRARRRPALPDARSTRPTSWASPTRSCRRPTCGCTSPRTPRARWSRSITSSTSISSA